jgi:hypothetical protein
MLGGVNAVRRESLDMTRRKRAQWFKRRKGRSTVNTKAAAQVKSQPK